MILPFAVLDLGMGQIILILIVVLLLFGAKKIPELARGLGQGIKEFKKAVHETDTPDTAATKPTPPEPPPSSKPTDRPPV